MRVVLDTNTVMSAMLWRGVAHRMFIVAQSKTVRFYTSPFMLDELERVLVRRKFDGMFFSRQTTRADLLQAYRTMVEIVCPKIVPAVVVNDPSDDHVLACAVEANAAVIVSGNNHLLELSPYREIAVLNAATFLARLEQN